MSDADMRPRPQYGEYATPDEQRAHIRQPDVTAAYETGHPATVPVVPAVAAPVEFAGGPRPARPLDRLVTLGLLGFGFVNVLFSAFGYFDLAAIIQRAWRLIGIDGAFTNIASAQLWGPIAAIVLVVGYVVTAVIALRSVRARRLSWWIPVVGAAITFVGVYACLLVPIIGDPAFVQYVTAA